MESSHASQDKKIARMGITVHATVGAEGGRQEGRKEVCVYFLVTLLTRHSAGQREIAGPHTWTYGLGGDKQPSIWAKAIRSSLPDALNSP